ncbi:MAG TPA: zinc ribbon domain-containing protein [Pyrinomonadaceae bacterium]|nr:zinc ribbon domain-containing protein [Pyrinomonadaceae bacterium]
MYCPNCGQQQISDEMRFCSRCGQALSGLAEWLAGAVLPVTRAETRAERRQAAAASPRRRGIRRAAKLMFFSGVLFPVFLVISLAVDEGGPLAIPLILFFVSLVMMLYARLFLDRQAPALYQSPQTSALGSTPSRSSLPPPTSIPVPNAGRHQVRTNELAQPPSVTENTTRLLDNE